jgi:hypothetical protein
LRVPERVKGWLTAGVGLFVLAVSEVDADRASTAGVALQNNNAQATSTTATRITILFSAYIFAHP